MSYTPPPNPGGRGWEGLMPNVMGIYEDLHGLLCGWCPKPFSEYCFLPPLQMTCLERRVTGKQALRLPALEIPASNPCP